MGNGGFDAHTRLRTEKYELRNTITKKSGFMIPALCWAHNEILTLIFALKTQNFSFFVNAFRKLRFRWKKPRMDFAPVSVKKTFWTARV